MRTRRLTAILVLLLLGTPLLAGSRFRFTNTTTGGPGSMAGIAEVDASGFRIDVTRGDGFLFQDGTIVLSNDGGQTLNVIDPSKKTYYALELERMFESAGAMLGQMGGMFEMSVRDVKVDVDEEGDGGKILGFPTRKYRIRAGWTMDLNLMGQKSSMAFTTDTEMFVTDAIPADHAMFLQLRDVRTGNPEIDELMEAQRAEVEGFPLKQVTRTRIGQGEQVDEQITTMHVSEIEQNVDIPASRFAVPAGFERVDSPLEALTKMRR